MAIRLDYSWTWLHFWSLLGFFWTKAKYAMRLNVWVSAGQLERGPDEFATFSQIDRQRSLAFDRNNQYSLLWRVPESGPAGFGDLSTNRQAGKCMFNTFDRNNQYSLHSVQTKKNTSHEELIREANQGLKFWNLDSTELLISIINVKWT